MSYLVTGGTGTLGAEFIRQVMEEKSTHQITVISRDEIKQKELKERFPKIRTVVCDIRDKNGVEDFMYKNYFSHIFHFAAMKHVDVCENQPIEAVKTNIIGTNNIISAAIKTCAPSIIFSSTDKAVEPINVYGMTKAIAEQELQSSFKDHVIFRWGNIIGSRGSVIPKFIKSIMKEEKVYLSHADMTRFWLRIEDAVSFMISTVEQNTCGVFMPSIKSSFVVHIAEIIAEILEVKNLKIEFIGVGNGEKIDERMTKDISSANCEKYTRDELFKMLYPVVINIAKGNL